MIRNAELKKNIWLDFTTHRVILTPIIVILFAYIWSLFGGRSSAETCAFLTAGFFIFVWGTKTASETVIEEVNNSTWDFQRQSSISPWSMTLGKLIGSTLFSWYGAAIAFLIYLLPFGSADTPIVIFNSYKITKIFIMIMGGLLGQATGLLLSLQVLPQARQEKSNPTFKYFIMGMFVGICFTNIALSAQILSNSTDMSVTISWYQWHIESDRFMITSLALFLLWAIIGLKRSFSNELQYPQIPWVWFAFNLYCLIYFSGLTVTNEYLISKTRLLELGLIQEQINQLPYLTAFMVAQVLTYIALVTEDLNRLRYKRMHIAVQNNLPWEALQSLPWWTISLVMTVLTMLLYLITQPDISNLTKEISPSIFVFTSTLFIFRDVLLFHFFYFEKNPRKAVSTSVIYLALLYLLIPLLLKGIHLETLIPIFLPSWGQNNVLGILSPLVQTGLLAFLCLKRWRQLENME